MNLKYKGMRDYLHGSDFFHEITRVLSSESQGYIAKLVFKSFARNQCDLHFEKPSEDRHIVGSGHWLDSNNNVTAFWIVENDVPVLDSYGFDEDLITNPALVEDKSIVGRSDNSYSAIENIIALAKKLNYSISPDVAGKWVFGQLSLHAGLPTQWKEMCIDQTSILAGRFSKNKIIIDGTEFGEIRFIVGNP